MVKLNGFFEGGIFVAIFIFTIQIHGDLSLRRVVTGDRAAVLILPELLDGQPGTGIIHVVILLLAAGYDHHIIFLQIFGFFSCIPSLISSLAFRFGKDDIHSGFVRRTHFVASRRRGLDKLVERISLDVEEPAALIVFQVITEVKDDLALFIGDMHRLTLVIDELCPIVVREIELCTLQACGGVQAIDLIQREHTFGYRTAGTQRFGRYVLLGVGIACKLCFIRKLHFIVRIQYVIVL